MKIQEIMLVLKTDGWYLIEENSICHQYKHPRKSGRITIAGNPNYDLGVDASNSILLQAGSKGAKS